YNAAALSFIFPLSLHDALPIYFRAVGADNVYGLSARGLAIDTAESGGEEFPWFREFWLVRPEPQDRQLTLYALLDSPSLAGAYRSEEHTSELQSREKLVCRLLL